MATPAQESGHDPMPVADMPMVGPAQIPCLGFGTVRLHGSECHDAVTHALDLGYRSIDTAQRYGNEADVGAAITASQVPRGDVFLTTKLDFPNYTLDRLELATRESLSRLGTDHVDLLLIHWPNPRVPLEETLTAMASVREKGLTRHIGVSNFTAEQVRTADETAPIAVNQIEYHPYLGQEVLLKTHRDLGIATTAYCPLARGVVLDDPVLADIAATHGKSVAQVALRWLVQQEGVGTVVRSSSSRHREANISIFDFTLDADEMGRIAALARGLRIIDPEFSPDWDPEQVDDL